VRWLAWFGSTCLLSENNSFLGGQLNASVGPRKGTQNGLRFDSHVRTVLRIQFLHNIADLNFHGAFTHVQIVGYYLIRLSENKAHRLDRDLKSHGYWDVAFAPWQMAVLANSASLL
jgi:hypothetical protein